VLGRASPVSSFVRGEQVSGRYTGIGSVLDEGRWFPTKDIATLDDAGYLFITGRSTTPSFAWREHRACRAGGCARRASACA